MGAERFPELTGSAGSPVLLELSAVSYTYPRAHREVLRDLTLDVHEGEFVSVVGPSGCGKSTLVSAVAGLLPGYQGSIRFRGQPIQRPHPQVGVVFQEDSTFPWRMLEPFMTQAELSDGAIPVVDQLTGPTDGFPISGVFTTEAFASKNPGTVAAFQRAMFKAQAFADLNRAAVEKILPTYIKNVSPTVASLVSLGVFPTGLDPVPLQRVCDLMFESHLLPYRLLVAKLLFR